MLERLLASLAKWGVEKLASWGWKYLRGLRKASKDKAKVGKESTAVNDAVAQLKKAKAENRNPTPEEIQRLVDASYHLNDNLY